MRFLILGASAMAAVASSAQNTEGLFKDFVQKYDKHYATDAEKQQRFQVFSENMEMIHASNAKNLTYTLGVTASTDQTFEEWRATHLSGFTPPALTATHDRDVFTVPENFAPPDSVDWVAKGAVTSVKNQGTCGSCWTFSTVGALEGAMFVAGRPLVELSMQHILACDSGGNGCLGGSMDQAFDWVAQNGVPALKDEPYLCKDKSATECTTMTCDRCVKQTGETSIFLGCTKIEGTVCSKEGLIHHCECPGDECYKPAGGTFPNGPGECGAAPLPTPLVLKVGDVLKHTDVPQTEDALEAAVAQQPVSVAIEADQSVFQHYTGGVLTNDACGSNLDHGVLVVGYGVDNGQMYWKVKNSWDTVFGEDGYIRIEKGKAGDGGECGIRKGAVFPTVQSAETVVVV